MNFPGIRAAVFALLAAAIVATPAPAPAQLANARLRALASQSKTKSAWNRLLRYARTEKNAEQKGLAYFVLGYRQYDANEDLAAIDNFQRAAETKFSLADFAEYYRAAAAREANEPEVVLKALSGFSGRYPRSTFKDAALELDARALLDGNQAQKAIAVLAADPQVRQKPELTVILADAYRAAAMPLDAARTYQEVYYAFPVSNEARAAAKALEELRKELGQEFPSVSQEIQTSRADKLYSRSRYQDALNEFESLMGAYPKSPLRERWQWSRARCLFRLRRVSAALDELQTAFKNNPALDAERLALLVDIYARQDDQISLDLIVDQLARLYPASQGYASALNRAGDFSVRKGDWKQAAAYYRPLAGRFPNTAAGLEANWRLAWSYYLLEDYGRARAGFEDHLRKYPDSWHAAAALFWLARMAEDHGAEGAARDLYEAVSRRFGLSYYAALSVKRLKVLAENRSGFHSGVTNGWTNVSDAAQQLPAPDTSPIAACSAAPQGSGPAAFVMLRSVGLDDLAEQYLRSIASRQPGNRQLDLTLSRLELEQGETAEGMFEAARAATGYWNFQFDQLPRQVWDLLYPRAYWPLVRSAAKARGLDPYLVMALIRQESAFNPRAVSVANARGLMQVLPQTAARTWRDRRMAARRLMIPAYNVRVGTNFLRKLSADFGGNTEDMIAAYHAGKVRVEAWNSQHSFQDPAEFLESIPIPATRGYAERVIRDAAIYRSLMTGAARFADCRSSGLSRRLSTSASAPHAARLRPGSLLRRSLIRMRPVGVNAE